MRSFSPAYQTTLLSTFILTIVVDITVAVEVGLIIACVVFIYRMSQLTRLEPLPANELHALGMELPENTSVQRLTGVLFFGSVSRIEPLLDPTSTLPKNLVLDLSSLLSTDSSGLDALGQADDTLRARGIRLVLADMRPNLLATMTRLGFIDRFGSDRIFPTLRGALTSVSESGPT